MLCYHFHANVLRDGRPISPFGEWLEHTGAVIPCESGLHASVHPLDALQYAPGATLDIVDLEGDLTPHGAPVDKYAGIRRKRVASIDTTDLCRAFARQQALSVAHLWDMPQVVREYLETGNESKRGAAGAAAWGAAWDAVRDAARAAARAAAWGAARAAARAAARDAAGAAAWGAAWDVQRDHFQRMVEQAFRDSGYAGDFPK